MKIGGEEQQVVALHVTPETSGKGFRLLRLIVRLLEAGFQRGAPDVSAPADVEARFRNLREFETGLKEMADDVAVHTGQAHLDELVKFLSSRFGFGIALAGLLDNAGKNIGTMAIAHDGVLGANFTYPLAGTPCEEVIRQDFCIYPDEVQRLFPDDRWFIEHKVRGYAGVRLRDSKGRTIGVISAVSFRPLHDIPGIESLFKLAALRAAAELDRMHQAAAAEENELRYNLAESGTADGLWDLNLETNIIYYSPRVGELLGLSVDELGEDPDMFWAHVHADDIGAVRRALAAHLDDGLPFDVQYRIRHSSGECRWFRTRGKTTRAVDGQPLRFTGGLTDITEGKRHQLQLKAENIWLAKFAAGAPLAELLAVMAGTGAQLFEDAALQVWLQDADAAPRVFPAADAAALDAGKLRALLDRTETKAGRMTADMPGWPRQDGGFDSAWLIPVTVPDAAQRVMLAVFYPAGRSQQAHERPIVEAAARLVRLALDNIRSAADLARQRLLFENLFHSTPEAMVILDRDDRVLDTNPQFTTVFQYERDEVRGRALNDLLVPPEFEREASGLSEMALRGGNVARESFRRRKDGSLLPVSILGAPVVGDTAAAYFAIYRDRSSLHEAAQRLDHQARHDFLTGLPNRYEFERRLRQATILSAEGQGSTGVIYFDLDQFKVVNDTAGHARGDDLLQELTRRLRPLVRSPHLLARLGGDEFAVLLVNSRPDDCEQLAQHIRARFGAGPFQFGERTFTVTASFGIVTVPAGSDQDPHEILSLADSACFLAKERGRNRVQVHDPGDPGTMQRREEMDWISRLNEALLEDRFALHYQRIEPVNVPANGAVAQQHCEILLRMIDSDGNNVPPAVFIPPAERYNLMPRIDRWMLEAVFARLARCGREEQERLLVAVNISGSTLSDEGLTEFIIRLFELHGVRPATVCFEITETAAIANFEDALRFISTVRGLGCRVALDDFGSGLSSFRYLKEIAPDYLKIDGSFVREIRHSRTDFSMVEAINRVGKSIGIRTVAEFVEDIETLRALRRIGVDFAQGYGLHRPEPWNL